MPTFNHKVIRTILATGERKRIGFYRACSEILINGPFSEKGDKYRSTALQVIIRELDPRTGSGKINTETCVFESIFD